MRNASALVRPRSVTGDGAGMVSHAGIAWLGETADLAGLTGGLRTAMTTIKAGCCFAFAEGWRWTRQNRQSQSALNGTEFRRDCPSGPLHNVRLRPRRSAALRHL